MSAASRIRGESMLWLIAAATIFSSQLVFGYAVVDKIVVYALLGVILFKVRRADRSAAASPRLSTLFKIHRLIFIVFALYGLLEAIRGMVVLGDPRVAFYASMFAVIGVLGWLSTGDTVEPARAARVIALASSIYFVLYILAGLVAESLLGMSRFDLQGSIWSGTTVAVFPAYLALPALAALPKDRARDKALFWATYLLVVLVGFYYQSRSLWIGLTAFIVIGAYWLGLRRTVVTVVILAAFLLIFPWDDPKPLTPARLGDDIAESVSNPSRLPDLIIDKLDGARAQVGDPVALLREPAAAPTASLPDPGRAPADQRAATSQWWSRPAEPFAVILGALVGALTLRLLVARRLVHKKPQGTAQAPVQSTAITLARVGAMLVGMIVVAAIVAVGTTAGSNPPATRSNATANPQPSIPAVPSTPAVIEQPAAPIHDADRVIAVKAAWCATSQDGIGRLLFGTGYWTSRYEMVGCVQRIAALYNYKFPPTYNTIVRTATFNGMLVDMGLVGVSLLALLLALTALGILAARTGPWLVSLGTLGLIVLSLFTSQNYGVLLLYLALMPGGALLLFHPGRGRLSRASQV